MGGDPMVSPRKSASVRHGPPATPPLASPPPASPTAHDATLALIGSVQGQVRSLEERVSSLDRLLADERGRLLALEDRVRQLELLQARAAPATTQVPPAPTTATSPAVAAPPANLKQHEAVEKQRILRVLEETNWDRKAAAEKLGMPRRTFYRRLTEYGIQ